jgi:hypothetical protein
LKAYQGSESQEIGRSSGLKGEDEWSENLWKELDSSRIDAYEKLREMGKLREIVRRGEIVWRGWESPLRRTGIIWGSNADYLQIIYLNNQLSLMSTWLHISGLIVESSIIQNSIFSKQ